MSNNDIDRLASVLVQWFEQEQWTITRDDQGRTVAVMTSGLMRLGSGPVEIDITALAKYLDEHRP